MKKKRVKYNNPYDDEDEEDTSTLASKLSKMRSWMKVDRRVPVTFNVGVAVLLIIAYLGLAFVSVPIALYLLVILLPTIYIFIRYIQLERCKKND